MNSTSDQESDDYAKEAKADPEHSPRLPQAIVWRITGFVVLAVISAAAVQLLRPLPLYAAILVAWAGLMVATTGVLWRLHAISIKRLVLFGLGWASLILLVYAEMRKEERDASGIENDWATWYWSGMGLAALAVAVWGIPRLIRKYREGR